MQHCQEKYGREQEERCYENQHYDQKVEASPWRIFSTRIDRGDRNDRFYRRLNLQFGKRLIW